MKKVFIILVFCFLLLISTNYAMAEGVTIGLDYLASGSFQEEGDSVDLTGYVLNGEYLNGNLKYNLDYAILTIEGGYDFNSLELTGGYRLNEGIYIIATYKNINVEESSLNALVIGVDGSFKLNEKMNLAGTVAYAPIAWGGSGAFSSSEAITGLSYGINLGYLITEQVNLVLKYENENYSQIEIGTTMITLGCSYAF